MTTYPWRAALTRWGDTLFRIALLLTDDRTAAERATTQAFTRSFATPNEDPEAALYAALLHAQPSRRNLFRRSTLPRVLNRIAPFDRALLGVWLLRDIDGARLLAVAGQPAEMMLPRLESALLMLLDSQDPAHTDSVAREAFGLWLRRRLGLAPSPVAEATALDPAQINEWQAAVDELRHALREAVGRQHLPTTCVEMIEINLLEPQAEETPHWWRQRAAWIGALIIVLCLIWIVKPWQQGLSGSTGAALTTKELVQETLDAWTTTPITGTIHRKVVATETYFRQLPLTTDVWLSHDSAQHRVEVRSGTSLVEWQVGDGAGRFSYAANPRYTSCDWALEASVLDQLPRTFTLSTAQQIAVRDSRLMSGAYGQGYHALRDALVASDLRSFGTRTEGKTPLLVLGYTDRRTTPERKLLLWIDPVKHELHAVREVAENGGQADARDLWRLQTSEQLETPVSVVPPSWSGPAQKRDRLLDPHCPGLDAEHIISLRSFVSNQWWGAQQWYVPAKLPQEIAYAAIVTPVSIAANSLDGNFVSAIFVGPDRWLSLRLIPRAASPPQGIDRGNWRVTLDEQAGALRGSVCRRFTDTQTSFCIPSMTITAHGWTREELLALIDSFRPSDGQTWLQYNELFLDPQPLTAEAKAVVQRSITAIQELKQQSLYSIAEQTARVAPGRPAWQDPYHVPPDLSLPEHAIQEQWLVYSDTQVVRLRKLTKHPQGDILGAEVIDGQRYSIYNFELGTTWTSSNDMPMIFAPSTQWTGETLLLTLLANDTLISVTEQNGSWLLEAPIDYQRLEASWYDARYLNMLGPTAWISDLVPRNFRQRVWIDKATGLPHHGAIVHLASQGHELEIVSVTVNVRPQPQPFPNTIFALPELPGSILHFEDDTESRLHLSDDSFPLTLPARMLTWNTSGIELTDELGTFSPPMFAPSALLGAIQNTVYGSATDLNRTGLIQATSYRFSEQTMSVTVRQGPRDLMRHILRYQSGLSPGRDQTWTSSRALSATIAGAQRTVWLLETPHQAALVFEVDDLLVHIVGPNAGVLERVVLPAVSKLEWTATTPTR